MYQTLKRLAVCSLVGLWLVQPLSAYAWTKKIDCEGGTLGGKTLENLSNTFTSSFTKTVYSNEKVASGSQSCRMGIGAGSEGWGEWGGIFTFPSKLPAGSQLWTRVSVYVPDNFSMATNTGMLKFIRIHTASPSVSNQGYHDLLFANSDYEILDAFTGTYKKPSMVFGYEGSGTTNYMAGLKPTNDPVKGKWETYELYLSLDSLGKDKGGKGEVRVWKNNQLLLDLTRDRTLVDASTYAESLFLFTFWNGAAPQTQNLYVDDIIMTSDTPSGRDAKGNPFIGGATSGPVPMAPSSANVQ